MNRYDIRNLATGKITHSYTAESPMEAQPAWGMLAWTEQVPVQDENGAPVLNEDGFPVTTPVEHPATYEVLVTDLTGTPEDPPWRDLRRVRNAMLASTDWTQLGDAPLTVEVQKAWADYRQALRDLPDQPGLDPRNPPWPMPPA